MRRRIVFVLLIALSFASFRDRERTWIALGDSITYLNDHLDETGNRVQKGFLTRVTESLPGLHYVNQGHNGWTAVRIAAEIEKLGLAKADIYSVFLGTNDWWHGGPLGSMEDYRNNSGSTTVYGAFRIIIDKLRSLNPQAKIVLITPMPRADFVYIGNHSNNAYGSYKAKNGHMLSEFAEAVSAIGHYERLPVVDLYNDRKLSIKELVRFKRLKDPATGEYHDYPYPFYADVPFNPATDEYPYPPPAIHMTYDGLHPSDEGNELIARKIVPVFRRWMR